MSGLWGQSAATDIDVKDFSMKKRFRKGLARETVIEVVASHKEQDALAQSIRDQPVTFTFNEKTGMVRVSKAEAPERKDYDTPSRNKAVV